MDINKGRPVPYVPVHAVARGGREGPRMRRRAQRHGVTWTRCVDRVYAARTRRFARAKDS